MVDPSFPVRLFMNGLHLNVDENDSLTSVANLLHRNNANAIIVRVGGIPKGIITAKDIVNGLLSIKKNPKEIKANEIMTSPLVMIHHEEPVTRAHDLMVQSGVRMLPVYHDEEVIGLVTGTDMLKDLSWYRQ